MSKYSTSIDSKLSARQAFTYMSEFQNVAQWDPGVRQATKLSEGSASLGSEFDVITVTNGREVPILYRIVEFEDNARVVLRGETKLLRSEDEIVVTSKGEGSIVTYTANLSLRGVFMLATPFLGPVLKKIGDRARDGLRRELNPD